MKKISLIMILTILCFTFSTATFAHSGNTDSNGGHYGPDGYHYHHGYPAHQHENGECPYNFDDKTGWNSGSSSSGGSHTNKTTSSSSDNAVTYSQPETEDQSPVLPVLIVLGIAASLYFYSLHIEEEKRIKQEQERRRQEREKFEKEKQYYTNKYGGKSAEQFVNIPPNIMIGDDNLPCEKGAKEYWGENLTVFITKNGNKYHRSTCRYGEYPYNIYRLSSYYSPCAKCKPVNIPDKAWYIEYLRIQQIKEHYGIK